jgi:hypothetical protein
MTTTAGHSFYIGPIGFFYNQVNDTGSWEPLVFIVASVPSLIYKCFYFFQDRFCLGWVKLMTIKLAFAAFLLDTQH